MSKCHVCGLYGSGRIHRGRGLERTQLERCGSKSDEDEGSIASSPIDKVSFELPFILR